MREGESVSVADFCIRAAGPADCRAIAALLESYAHERIFLWRAPEHIAAHVDCFRVAVLDDELVGCAALNDYGNGARLQEVRSLAVRRDCWGRGIGAALVGDCVARARASRGRCVFALTRQVEFFSRCGFHVTRKSEFPEKVWADCRFCRKREHCDETAMRLDLLPGPAGDGDC